MTEKLHAREETGPAPAPAEPVLTPQPDAAPTARAPRQPFLSERVRGVLTIFFALLSIFGIVSTLRAFRAPRPKDTLVHVRAGGAGVPVYFGAENDARIHWLEPGAAVHLTDAEARGKSERYLVVVPIEHAMVVCGYVDRKDLDAAEVGRVRSAKTE